MKSKISFLAPLILILLMAVILIPAPSSHANGLLAGEIICLDPGHGGSDPGAVNGDLHESDINLDIAYRLKELLSLPDLGADRVELTRRDDTPWTNSDRYTYCNSINATIVVSVHTNSITDITLDGSMTLYAPSREPDLAQAIQDVMYPYLRDSAPDRVVEFKDYELYKFASGVLFKCDALAAAMVEPVFMSHPEEAKLLVQPINTNGLICVDENPGREGYPCRREQIAQAVFEGVKNYFAEPQLAQMHVSDIDMEYQISRAFYFITTEVVIQDEDSQPLSGATIELEITRNGDLVTSKKIVTDDEGLASYKLRSKLSGSYTSAVIDVSKSGFDYDSGSIISFTLNVPE